MLLFPKSVRGKVWITLSGQLLRRIFHRMDSCSSFIRNRLAYLNVSGLHFSFRDSDFNGVIDNSFDGDKDFQGHQVILCIGCCGSKRTGVKD